MWVSQPTSRLSNTDPQPKPDPAADTPAGPRAGLLLVRSHRADLAAVAKHLKWPEAKVQAAINYSEAFPEEIEGALSENAAADLGALKRMLPQATKFASRRAKKSRDA